MLLYQVATFSDDNHVISATIKYIKNKKASGVAIPEVFDFFGEAEKRFSCHSLGEKRISIWLSMNKSHRGVLLPGWTAFQ